MINDAGRNRREGDDTTLAPASITSDTHPPLRRVDSAALLSGAREIEIAHRGELYRLRCTSKGKLILTK